MQKIFEVVIAMMLVPGHFNAYHEMKHNSAITHQNQLEFWNQQSKILVLEVIFLVPDPLL